MLCYQTTKNKTCNFCKGLFTASVSIISEQPSFIRVDCAAGIFKAGSLSIQSLLSTGKKKLASQFNFTYRYIDDVLSINNPDFENYLGQMYPAELEIKDTTESNTSASYLDLLLSIESNGQLRTSLYDKRDDFNFHITNFPFLSSNIPSSPAYGVFISQLIRYARACSSYECFILRAARLSSKLLGQGYVMERFEIVPKEVLWSIFGSHQTL